MMGVGDALAAGEAEPVCTGVKDKNGNLLFLGDRVRYPKSGKHTKEEYWNPEYEIIWDAPAFTLRHVGGGKDGGSHDFILRHGGLELVARGPAYTHPPQPSVTVAEAALEACRIIDAAVREGHDNVSDLILHFMEAVEPARSALRALTGEKA